MRRLFWLALGIALGMAAVRKLSRAAERLSPSGVAEGIAAGLSELAQALRDFAGDVREGMSAREKDLRAAAGLDAGAPESAV